VFIELTFAITSAHKRLHSHLLLDEKKSKSLKFKLCYKLHLLENPSPNFIKGIDGIVEDVKLDRTKAAQVD
jgi:hypothetical protein